MAATQLIMIYRHGSIFHRSLVSPSFTFFTDDADGIMMFFNDDPERMPLCGYGAEESLLEVVLEGKWEWAREDMVYNIRCMLEDNNSS